MAIVNHAKQEINAKIVYYGAEYSGKGTSLRYAYDRIKPSLRGKLKELTASDSSVLFFDFNPFEQPVFGGYRVCFHIYTLQGKVTNPAAWKMMLKGADGLVIVADASSEVIPGVRQSLSRAREIFNGYGVGLDNIPVVLQLNKTDLAGRALTEEAARLLALEGFGAYLTTAARGEGVLETLTHLSRLVMERLRTRDDVALDGSQGDAANADVLNGAENAALEPLPLQIAPGAEENSLSSVKFEAATGIQVAISGEGVLVEGGNVRIPLDVDCSGKVQRLVLTVSVATA